MRKNTEMFEQKKACANWNGDDNLCIQHSIQKNSFIYVEQLLYHQVRLKFLKTFNQLPFLYKI